MLRCSVLNHTAASFPSLDQVALMVVPQDPALLFPTAGVSQAVDILCNVFAKSGDIVLCEDPTFYCIPQIFQDRGTAAWWLLRGSGCVVAAAWRLLRGGHLFAVRTISVARRI